MSISSLWGRVLQRTWKGRARFEIPISILGGYHPEVELLDHLVVLVLILEGFSTVAAPFCNPTDTPHGPRDSVSPRPHPTCSSVFVLKVAVLMGGEILARCGFDFLFSDDEG